MLASPGAIAGMKVVELSTVLAGPLCAQILADHGATVVKVEPPGGDATRRTPPTIAGQAAYYSGVNRNKSAIALDLSKPAGRAVLLRLLAGADVLLENFLPGTLERWDLDYEAVLKPTFPRLVHCSITGFGSDGPLGGRPGYDAVVQAYCGLMSINGTAESGPVRHGIPIVDVATGMNAAIGILLALAERGRSGLGQRIEVALFDSALALQHPYGANWMASGETPGPVGNGHPNLSPYDKFAARDGAVFIGVANDAQFRRLAEVLGCPALADDPRFATARARVRDVEALRAILSERIARRGAEELAEALMEAKVAAAPVNTVPQAFATPHTAHRGMHARLGDWQGVGIPIRMDRTPGAIRTPPPGLGADTKAVLASLGYAPEEIAALLTEGAARGPAGT